MLPRLKPRCFADLVIATALIRPGPLQGDMVHPYLRRRLGQEPVTYLHPRLEPALAETLGVILFQEQVLKVARDLAGFTPGQGELLRRMLGSKRGQAKIDRLQTSFIQGAQANGVPPEIATRVFAQLQAFGGFSFAKSHAAAFAGLIYHSAWLKRYYPAAFLCALLNNQPMGFWSPAVLTGDARPHGVEVRPVDIHRSQARSALEGVAVRLGFNRIDGFGEAAIARLVTARQAGGPFRDLADLCRRTRLPRRLVERLILAGALDGWDRPRRQVVWDLGQLRYRAEELPLTYPAQAVDLPPLSPAEALAWESGVLGLSTGEQVMQFYRPWLAGQGISRKKKRGSKNKISMEVYDNEKN
jgi:error-prone DNA polymerase